MNNQKQNLSVRESSHVGSFGSLMTMIRQQIEASAFRREDQSQVEEIVRILAEMFVLPADVTVSIGGIKMPAAFVREIYGILEHDHVELVLRKYRQQAHAIRCPKSYLRTALYNAAFELESRVTNDVAQDLT